MKNYCKYCGHKLQEQEIESAFYNEETGEKEFSKSCVNVKCDYSIRKCQNCHKILTGSWLPYELAKKLKEAGFPQEDEQGYISCGCSRERVYFPTLSELIEACGDDFMLTNEECVYTDKNNIWLAWQGSTNPYVMMGESGAIHQRGGSTPEEAVANLWLKINTK